MDIPTTQGVAHMVKVLRQRSEMTRKHMTRKQYDYISANNGHTYTSVAHMVKVLRRRIEMWKIEVQESGSKEVV